MTLSELRITATQYAMQFWSMDFNIQIKISSRLRATLAKYVYEVDKENSKIQPKHIEFSQFCLNFYEDDHIKKALKQELCKWVLSTQGKPFKNTSREFQEEMKKII